MVDILYVIVRRLLDSCARCETERKETAETMRILLVHGIGRSDIDPNYYQPWEQAISTDLSKAGLGPAPSMWNFTTMMRLKSTIAGHTYMLRR